MIIETKSLDELQEQALCRIIPSEHYVRDVLIGTLQEFEKEGMDTSRMSHWERNKVVTEAVKRIRERTH